MPRKGYRSFTVSNEVYSKLEKQAEELELSISKTVEYLLTRKEA